MENFSTLVLISESIGVGDGGEKARAPLKFRKKIFFRQLLCKIRAFSGKNHVK